MSSKIPTIVTTTGEFLRDRFLEKDFPNICYKVIKFDYMNSDVLFYGDSKCIEYVEYLAKEISKTHEKLKKKYGRVYLDMEENIIKTMYTTDNPLGDKLAELSVCLLCLVDDSGTMKVVNVEDLSNPTPEGVVLH